MKRRHSAIVAIGIGLALSLTACGDDDGGSGSDNGDGGSGGEAGKIGVILPDTESSVRWESADRPALEAAFEEAGVEYDIQNAEGDAEKMTQIADSMIADGVTVLAIVNLDSASGAAIQEKAKSQGVATIDYDRLTLGGSAEYYVSFDNTVVGELQGQGLADCLGDKPANIIYLNGSPTDNNATLFSDGAHSVLDEMTQLQERRRAGRARLGQRRGRCHLPAALHRCRRSGGRRPRRQRRSRRRGDLDPRGQRAGRQGPGHRSGRDRRGSAERPRRPAVHDGLQVRHAGGRRARRSRDRAGDRRRRRRPPAPWRTPRAAATCRRSC